MSSVFKNNSFGLLFFSLSSSSNHILFPVFTIVDEKESDLRRNSENRNANSFEHVKNDDAPNMLKIMKFIL